MSKKKQHEIVSLGSVYVGDTLAENDYASVRSALELGHKVTVRIDTKGWLDFVVEEGE